MRPKIVPPAVASQDFLIQGPRDHGVDGLINLFGIESPGLTSSLAIADHVGELAERVSGLKVMPRPITDAQQIMLRILREHHLTCLGA